MGDSGGFDECFPTVSACRLPSWVKGASNTPLPDHGELWSQVPRLTIGTSEYGHSATCLWASPAPQSDRSSPGQPDGPQPFSQAFPFQFERKLTVRRDGSVTFEYAVQNDGEARLPFVWSSHPVFPLTDSSRIVIPEGSRTRVWAQHGVDLGGPGAEHHWPRFRAGGKLLDLSKPSVVRQDFACKLFVDLPRTEVVVALEERDARLEMHLHGRQVPQVGLWINRRGWPAVEQSFLRRRAVPHSTIAIEPCLGAPDSLSEALGAWDAAQWVEAGSVARWAMMWRGVRTRDEG